MTFKVADIEEVGQGGAQPGLVVRLQFASLVDGAQPDADLSVELSRQSGEPQSPQKNGSLGCPLSPIFR